MRDRGKAGDWKKFRLTDPGYKPKQINELQNNDDRLAFAYMIVYTSNFNYDYLYYFLKICIQEDDIETAKFILEKFKCDIMDYIHDYIEHEEGLIQALDLIKSIDPKFEEKYYRYQNF